MGKRITAMYFSATDTTKKIVTTIAEELVKQENTYPLKIKDFTLPGVRKESVTFSEEDLVILGVPVYAGRVPNVLLKYLNSIKGQGAKAVPVVVYGNRNYDDALIELRDILENNGFRIVAGGAFIAEHSFSKILAKDRPDTEDMTLIQNFARQIYCKICKQELFTTPTFKGNQPYRSYYVPKDREGNPFDFRKITPKTSSTCNDCKLCAKVCPMGSIDYENVSQIIGPCIKCCACIKKCPSQVKYFDDPGYLNHKYELEEGCTERREPEIFI